MIGMFLAGYVAMADCQRDMQLSVKVHGKTVCISRIGDVAVDPGVNLDDAADRIVRALAGAARRLNQQRAPEPNGGQGT